MAVTTIINYNENKSSKVLIYVIGILGVALVVFFGGQLIEILSNKNGKAGLSVNILKSAASVYVDGEKVGETPYTSSTIKPGTRTIAIKNDTGQYQTSINFIPAENNVVHMVGIIRDLGISDTFSSGQEFWFEKDKSGNMVRIISEPSGATVSIDKTEVGKTPFSSASISPGSYTITISHPNHEPQTNAIVIQKGYTLNGNIKLFPYPVPEGVRPMEGSDKLFDLTVDNQAAYADTILWAKAVLYWGSTRGINIGNTIGSKEKTFDFFLDFKGNIFNSEGNIIKDSAEISQMGELKKGGYLGRTTDGAGLTKEAKEALNTLSGVSIGTKIATVRQTPYGWLRVRDTASLNGVEVGKVNTGDKYNVIEEKTGWVKIKVSDTLTGWVSSDYVSLSE